MVLLTITPTIVEALEKLPLKEQKEVQTNNTTQSVVLPPQPDITCPTEGQPIAHQQVLKLWEEIPGHGITGFSLEKLLQGSRVYIPPPPPKPEQSPEFKALMERLRQEEEERKYQRMTNPSKIAAFSNQSPNAVAFAEVNRPRNEDIGNDEDATYEEVQRQLMLIVNFLISIVGVAATLWIVARWWSTPARLALSMGGAIVVAITEVAVYAAFVWRVDKSEQKSKKSDQRKKEVRSITQTWTIGQKGVENGDSYDKQAIAGQTVSGQTADVDQQTAEFSLRRRVLASEK
ncbi:hypothetical protein Cpir12675_001559 [Ceratocystis pirilliformis]|uniref:Endoplasmic reticulum-based factor for assembly of V-ATPase n=1 Tax=Ceratocystis pirilliformis TaxID=259994 RepID=A0ABR3ZF06_9PEZI